MKQTENNNTNLKKSTISGFTDFNLKELILKYVRHWYWFLVSFIIFFAIAFISLRYSVPMYSVSSTILVSQEDNLQDAGLATFKDLGLNQTLEKIENEIQILKSKTLVRKVVQKLNLNVQYFYEGRVLDIEEYLNPLIKIDFLNKSEVFSKMYGTFTIKIDSETSFSFLDEDKNPIATHQFLNSVDTKFGKVVITPNIKDFSNAIGKIIQIKLLPVRSVVESYRARLQIIPVGVSSSVLQVSLLDPIILRAQDFIDNLVAEYQSRAIKKKNETSERTADFINDRLVEISKNLSNVDVAAAQYMAKFGVNDNIEGQSNRLIDIAIENDREITKNKTQMLLIESTEASIKNQKSNDNLIPSDLNVDDSSISTDVGKYNLLILKRKRLLKNSSTENPVIVKIDEELDGLKKVLYQNLKRFKEQTKIKLTALEKKREEIKQKLSQTPQIQKDLREISREQGVTEKLYLYLLQKKEEADITSHITVANSSVLDKASPVSMLPVSPNRKTTYLLYGLLGFLVPFVTIYAGSLLNTNVKSKKDIEALLSAPLIGSIPKNKSKDKLVITNTNNSPISEAFRILRSNLDFLLKGAAKDKGKIIFVTSNISGEGKTFISSNIAKSLAVIGKKVAYVGADFRFPKFHEIFNFPEGKTTTGFTNYIIDASIKEEDIIYQQDKGFYVIPSGIIPPNPSELLVDSRVETMFSYLAKHFDYVVVDTAPISLVTDTLLISEYADTTIHVVKEGFSDKRLLNIPEGYSKEGRLVNLSVLLNFASSNMSGAYGYGYGYHSK